MQAALNANGGCYVSNGTIIYPNAPGTYGNMGRNIFRGYPFYNWDSSIGKVWALSERLKLQFRGEVFNVINHPDFASGCMTHDLYSTHTGRTLYTPDECASNPVIGSGGSRHIQLGLKLLW